MKAKIKQFLIYSLLLTITLGSWSCSDEDDVEPDGINNEVIIGDIRINVNGNTTSTCIGNTENIVNGEGEITTTTLSFEEFDKIELVVPASIIISQGVTQEVKLKGHPNVIDRVTTAVSDNWLKIGLEKGCYQNFELSIEVTVPILEALKLRGVGELTINDFESQSESLELDINSVSNVTINKFEGIETLSIDLNGTGNFTASQNISTLEILNLDISGTGSYLGFPLNSKNAIARVSGIGYGELTVTDSLNAAIQGIGNLYYKGSPSITQTIRGLGKVIDAN